MSQNRTDQYSVNVEEKECTSLTLSSADLVTLTELLGSLKRIVVSSAETVISFDSGASLKLPTKVRMDVSIDSGSANVETSSEKMPLEGLIEGWIEIYTDFLRWKCSCGHVGKWQKSRDLLWDKWGEHARAQHPGRAVMWLSDFKKPLNKPVLNYKRDYTLPHNGWMVRTGNRTQWFCECGGWGHVHAASDNSASDERWSRYRWTQHAGAKEGAWWGEQNEFYVRGADGTLRPALKWDSVVHTNV